MKAVIELNALRPVLPQFSSCGISISESRHAPGFTMPLSRYDFSEVMLVLDGEGWVEHRSVRQSLSKKQVILVPRGATYRFEDNAKTPLSILCLCLKPARELLPIFSPVLPSRFAVLRKPSLCTEVSGSLRGILHEQSSPGPGSEQFVVAQSLLLLTRLQRLGAHALEESPPPPSLREVELLARVRDYADALNATYHQQETLEMVAARLGMSPKTLTRHFRAITGKSRRRYIEELRLQNANRLLRESQQSVTSIAFACGFEDLSTFFRAFRTKFDMSPGDWRETHAE